jgi:outer membrane protein assembly factor BamB
MLSLQNVYQLPYCRGMHLDHGLIDKLARRSFTGAVAFILLSQSSFAAAPADASAKANWPQWRGPLANGVAPEAKPPVSWSETNNVKWKQKLPGAGISTPIIWGNQIFIETAILVHKKDPQPKASLGQPQVAGLADPSAQPAPQRRRPAGGGMRSEKPTEPYQFVLLCLDRASGKTLWQKVAREETPHEGHHPDHGFASHSPITDGKSVFAYFGSRGLHCYDLNGTLRWEKDFGRMQTKNSFGEGSSPALFGNVVVVNWDHEGEDFIVALDKETGRQLWKQPRTEETSWATPLIVPHGDHVEVITDATQKIRSYDLTSGKLLWQCAGLFSNVIPSPVAGHGMVYSMSGFRGNALLAIRLGRTGDLTGTEAIAWSHSKSTPYVPSPLLYGNDLYFFAGNNGMLSCFDAQTGKPHFEAERIEALMGVYASPVAANGNVYLIGRNGTAVVIKQSEKLELLATNRLQDRFDASPAIAGKELYLRGHDYLYCVAE